MNRYTRPIAIGATIGTLASVMFIGATFLFAASADEEPLKTALSTQTQLFPPAFNTDNIVKFNDAEYLMGVEASVSLDPLSTGVVRKIGYGKTEFVTISTTSSGVYSSDGLASPHFRYPGIHMKRLKAADANSVVIILPREGATGAQDCLHGGSFVIC